MIVSEEERQLRASLLQITESRKRMLDQKEAELQSLCNTVVYIRSQIESASILTKTPPGELINKTRALPCTQKSNEFIDCTIVESAVIILACASAPMHAKDLWLLSLAGGYPCKTGFGLMSMVTSLTRSDKFDRVGPNTFALANRSHE